MSNTPCQSCGCLGNSSCGCEPVSKDLCSLNEVLDCACCDILGKEKNIARWPENNIKPDAVQETLSFI